jgi:hypothetical protein
LFFSALGAAFPDLCLPQFAGPFPAAAKSKGVKGAAGNLQICIPFRMICQQRRELPLPPAARKRHKGK